MFQETAKCCAPIEAPGQHLLTYPPLGGRPRLLRTKATKAAAAAATTTTTSTSSTNRFTVFSLISRRRRHSRCNSSSSSSSDRLRRKSVVTAIVKVRLAALSVVVFVVVSQGLQTS